MQCAESVGCISCLSPGNDLLEARFIYVDALTRTVYIMVWLLSASLLVKSFYSFSIKSPVTFYHQEFWGFITTLSILFGMCCCCPIKKKRLDGDVNKGASECFEVAHFQKIVDQNAPISRASPWIQWDRIVLLSNMTLVWDLCVLKWLCFSGGNDDTWTESEEVPEDDSAVR